MVLAICTVSLAYDILRVRTNATTEDMDFISDALVEILECNIREDMRANLTIELSVEPCARFSLDDDMSPLNSAALAKNNPASLLLPDVHAQIFLKLGATLAFPLVQSTAIRDGSLIVEMYMGLRIRIEEGVTVSGIRDPHDPMNVFGDNASGYQLSATVIISFAFSYVIDNVTTV
ncbi:hypothetical protein K458DRAFT_406585 [Lentithecium fluviatile CBS 122367]|uniref:Uncharacterized protein n=1 Tax=Lentithecium fluviatile CBS 122367 TaxID=1168545 RepID=A0A6G1ISL5_9PLEO|nr:hypothetical protein K458DRAFT_406585 [Lentithecium fluviatile CBS 122367]